MPNPFINKNVFNPNLAAEVAAAYERNRHDGLVASALAGGLGAQSLASIVKKNTANAKENGSAGLANCFEQFRDPDTRRAFEVSFAAAEELFGLIGITIPTLEECVVAGVDLQAIGSAYEQMKLDELEPEVVLSPNLSLDKWRELYQDLVHSTASSNGCLKDVGLQVHSEVIACWQELAMPDEDVPVIAPSSMKHSWTLRLIPGTDSPTDTGITHSYNQSVHPTVGEYLTAQAILIQANLEPLDSGHTYTWLNGTFHGKFNLLSTPYGNWGDGVGRVNIGSGGPERISINLGTRLPVWK